MPALFTIFAIKCKLLMDAYGQALKAYFGGKKKATIKVESDIAETEYWPLKEFFHDWKNMSTIEREALKLCRGRVLDVGAGSGSHSLWLQSEGLDVTPIDVSPGAVEVMTERGLHAQHIDFYAAPGYAPLGGKFDTIISLMNGAGIAGTMDNLPRFLLTCKQLLNDGGRILMDSSDLIYLFMDEDGSALIDLDSSYYGELRYKMSYAGETDEEFPWLFIDYDNLEEIARREGFKCRKVFEDDHYQYLAELSL